MEYMFKFRGGKEIEVDAGISDPYTMPAIRMKSEVPCQRKVYKMNLRWLKPESSLMKLTVFFFFFFCCVDNHLLVQDLYSMSPEGYCT